MFPKTEAELKEFLRTVHICTVCDQLFKRNTMRGNYCKPCYTLKQKFYMRTRRKQKAVEYAKMTRAHILTPKQ